MMGKTASPSSSMRVVSGAVYTRRLPTDHARSCEPMRVKGPAWDVRPPLLGLASGVTHCRGWDFFCGQRVC